MLRRVGVGRLEEGRSEYHAGRMEKEETSKGEPRDSVHVLHHMAGGVREGEREMDTSRDATWTGESEMAHSRFIGPLRLVLVTR